MKKFKIVRTTKTIRRVVPAKSINNMLTVIDYNTLIALEGNGLSYNKDNSLKLSKCKKFKK